MRFIEVKINYELAVGLEPNIEILFVVIEILLVPSIYKLVLKRIKTMITWFKDFLPIFIPLLRKGLPKAQEDESKKKESKIILIIFFYEFSDGAFLNTKRNLQAQPAT